MIVSIHQPSYFPWLGLLHKIKNSEVFIYLDNVQLADRAYQHRNIFLTNQNKEQLLTIPINKKNYREKTIDDLELNNNLWREKHLNFIKLNYKKHPYYLELIEDIENFYKKEFFKLNDVLFESMKISLKLFNINTKVIKASTLGIDPLLKKEELILEILNKVNATTYLSGTGARNYQNEDTFEKAGVQLTYQDFTHPIYKQFKNTDFISGINCLDVLFNLGKDKAFKLLGDNK